MTRRMLPRYDILTAERLRELLDYDPETGVFIWKSRPPDGFQPGNRSAEGRCRGWNKKHAGKRAGALAGYRMVRVISRTYAEHRLAWLYMTGEWPSDQIDHINGQKDDNRFVNLREATPSQNMANARRQHRTATPKGVRYHSRDRRWYAGIVHNRIPLHLGIFDTPEEAAAAYAAAARELFGEFARPE